MIDVKDLIKKYKTENKETVVLNNINMTIKEGEFLIIMGESGCGKTTLLNCISGFDKQHEGQILINEKDMAKLKGKELEQMRLHTFGFIFQENYLIDNLTLLENVAITRLQYDANAYEKADELLKQMHIDHLKEHYPSQASGGQKQRCAIARSLVNDASILFADEPTAALDRNTADEIMDLLAQLHQQGQTILMVTHSPKIAAYGSRVLFMEEGSFVFDEDLQNHNLDEKYQRIMEITERKDS